MAGVAGEVTPFDLVETSDRWVLPIGDESVMACCIDYAITLRFGNEVSVRIEQPFVYRTGDGVEHLIVPEANPVRLAPALAVTRLVVRQGFAFKDGHLELHFADGSLVCVPQRRTSNHGNSSGLRGFASCPFRAVTWRSGDLR